MESHATGSAAAAAVEKTLEQAIGVQVRMLRRRIGVTVAELAAASGISGGMLSKIENGQISPSLATLQALALALNVPITNFFASFEEKRDCSFVKAGTGVVIERRGSKAGHQYSLLGAALGGTLRVEPYLITLQEDAASYTAFQHEGTEFIYMLSGEVVYRHGDQAYHLTPGDALLFDSAAPHGPEKLLTQPISYLSIIAYTREST
ncbi:helix-turn-helix domain-containing protein [Acidocella sp.]|uniref:helix-turn-helix domain-containing protein n=1 Tax=Acidocella sp. TaxID=50710 RepID=UPI002627988C|nr:helix-turn-helix domain-containing protein [Acidocella sp.]MDD2795380.1 helix-turn-helix domain-containing protein [Acidocella sp.]